MTSWELLDTEEEFELHKTRLLNVEEKPFKRITKRLGTISSLVNTTLASAPNGQNGAASDVPPSEQLRTDLTLDFAALNSTITRLQFLHDANQRERERYQADQERILAECQAVRDNNVQLREQLEVARAQLAQRKKFDELADKITSNRLLRPREDQLVNLAKLEDECRELERESGTYSLTWKERQNQFNRIMEEGMLLRRQIRDEKEEVERREGMDDADEEDGAAPTPRNEPSRTETPHPDGDTQPKGDAESNQLSIPNGVATPSAGTPAPDSLRPASANIASLSRSGSQAPSRDASPMPPTEGSRPEPGEDVEMEDSGRSTRDAEDDGKDAAAGGAPDTEVNRMEVDE
ncbi:Tho complex subunit 7-domain-containing protein [Stachybotrys elegans]|uniref:Tho complex subunit 7-domain-containing protein n=1 Tax=Stachybotrys elegans TaxID=80388 RepID=A0A8K0WY06_9HYPO|nr:Tho complex subunit 7-domain-containing protein [Stachybotrys elegans]